jgi:hypothetical protein
MLNYKCSNTTKSQGHTTFIKSPYDDRDIKLLFLKDDKIILSKPLWVAKDGIIILINELPVSLKDDSATMNRRLNHKRKLTQTNHFDR